MDNQICNTIKIGEICTSNTGERFQVIERIGKKARIKFLDEYGAEIVRQYTAVKHGNVKNPYEIVVFGVGRHGNVDYTWKEKDYWKYLCERYSQGKLPHFNPRWLVLEYWLKDIRQIEDYDLFLCRKNVSIFDPFHRFDRIEHLRVFLQDPRARGVVLYDMFDGSYQLFCSRYECAYETGWHEDSIFDFCHAQAERDGYKFYWASDFIEEYPHLFT